MDSNVAFHNLTSKNTPFLKLIIYIKTNIPGSSIFYYLLFLIKLLGVLIITDNFYLTEEDLKLVSVKPSNFLLNFTAFRIFSNLSFDGYTTISVSLFIFVLIFYLTFYMLYRKIKNTVYFIETPTYIHQIRYFSWFFIIILILCQHMLEFFSFIFLMYFKSNSSNINEVNVPLFNYFLTNSSSKHVGIILIIINFTAILLLNLFFYLSYQILNEPYFETKFPVNFRFSRATVFLYIFLSNLQGIHYYENFISSANLIKYKIIIFSIINSFIIFEFFRSYRRFNFNHFFTNTIYFLITYIFFSSIIEVVVSTVSILQISDFKQFAFNYSCKILVSICFMFINQKIINKLFIDRCKISLFKEFNEKLSKNDLECFYQFIDILIQIKNNKNHEISKILRIILSHRDKCGFEYCKCNNFMNLKNIDLLNEINLILDGVFVNVNLSQDEDINLLFAEYLCILKNSTLFSYAIINTFINKNIYSKHNTRFLKLKIFHLYQLSVKKSEKFRKKLKEENTQEYVNFILIYNEIEKTKSYSKIISKFIVNFEKILNIKENFDLSIKYEFLENGDLKVDSNVSGLPLKNLIHCSQTYMSLYKKIKKVIRNDYSETQCKSTELCFKLFHFFKIFNKKTPKRIAHILNIDESVSADLNCNYFNRIFIKFFKDDSIALPLIIEINNSFKIKYFSHKLSEVLGYNYNKLIGDDMHAIFPSQLRDQHKKVLLHHFLIKRQTYFEKKTFAFTASNNILPVFLKVSTFPNLKKNLLAIATIRLLHDVEKSKYYFVLSDKYELIALSKNLEDSFGMTHDLMEKLNVDVLKTFDMTGMLSLNFKKVLEKLKISKEQKSSQSLYSLSHYVFNLNFVDEYNFMKKAKLQIGSAAIIEKSNDANNNLNATQDDNYLKTRIDSTINGGPNKNNDGKLNFQPTLNQNKYPDSDSKDFKDHISIRTSKNSLFTNSDYDDQDHITKQNENLFVTIKEKKVIIRNFEKIKNRSKDMDVGPQYYTKISNTINLLKLAKRVISTKQMRFLTMDKPEQYKIKVHFRKINDVPFYIIELQEHNQELKNNLVNTLKKKPTIAEVFDEETFEDESKARLLHNNKLKSNKKIPKSENSEKFSSVVKYTDILSVNAIDLNNTCVDKKPYFSVVKKKENKLKNVLSRKKFFIIILIFLLICNITLSLITLLYKGFCLKNMKLIYLMSFYNSFQFSSLTFLNSSVLSFIFKLADFTSFTTKNGNIDNISIDLLKDIIAQRVINYRDNFNSNIKSNNQLDYVLTDLNNEIYSLKDFNKINLTWKNILNKQTTPNAMDYICTNLNFLTLDKEFSGLVKDIEGYFVFRKFKNLDSQNVATSSQHSKIVYFINENMLTMEQTYNNSVIIIRIQMNFYYNIWIIVGVVLEIVEIVISIFLMINIYYFINIIGKLAFKRVLGMFLNLINGKKNPYIPNKDTNFIKNKINTYKTLLKIFNPTTISEIQEMPTKLNAAGKKGKLEKLQKINNEKITYPDTAIALATPKPLVNDAEISKDTSISKNTSINNPFLNDIGSRATNFSAGLQVNHVVSTSSTFQRFINPNRNKIDYFQPTSIKDKNLSKDTITNENIYKNLKLHQLFFIKILKLLVILVFSLFIIFLIANIFSNLFYFLSLTHNIDNSQNILLRYTVFTNLYNNLRLMIIENNNQRATQINVNFNNLTVINDNFIKAFNSKDSQLILTYNYINNINLNNEQAKASQINKDDIICKGNKICSQILSNGLNSKGIDLSLQSSIQVLNNIYKDFLTFFQNSNKNLNDLQTIRNFFMTEEFTNVNLQTEFIFSKINTDYLNFILTDLINIFDFYQKNILLLAILPVLFNLTIILLIIFGHTLFLRKSLICIDYTWKKFNIVIYDL